PCSPPSPVPARTPCSGRTSRTGRCSAMRDPAGCGSATGRRARARGEMVEALRALDAELGDKPYLAGQAFGFTDLAVVPFAAWLPGYARLGEFSLEEACPRLAAWAEWRGERESIASNMHPPEK